MRQLINTICIIGVLVMLWLAATDLLGPAIDHELDRMPTAESVAAVVEDEPETMTMTATAYSWGCGNGDGMTATMTPVREGVIAVDPKVIPLGTQVEINGQVCWAEDTGSAIVGNRIDIFMESREEALSWGRQYVTAKIIP